MTTFLQTLETFFWNVLNRPGLSDIADILIVAIIIYELLMLTRDTRGSAVLKGLAMLLLIVGISNLFGLTALNWLLMSVVNNGALVLVILFQPELRKALEQIGRGARIETKRRDTDKDEATRIIDEIIRCLQDLSRRHVGALIVFEQKTGLQDIIENGIGIDAQHLPFIFDRFYRVDKSHSKASGGTGLGLSIVKHAAMYHGGKVELESQVGSGTEIRVTLPLPR